MRVFIGLACRALGDADSAALELESAHGMFVALQAAPDAVRVDGLLSRPQPVHGLTPRELEVLRLVAMGYTDRQIAEEIYVSPRTVQNHLARIRDKTGLRRRSELTRWAVVHAVY